MQYWRMQLHPAESDTAMAHTVQSVAAGFIGLDFAGACGDLRVADPTNVKAGERDYFDFANRMQIEDVVLIVVHHYQFALVTVGGDYNYVARREPELGVWFRHFRRIDKAKTLYWADRVTNARDWEPITMTDTISVLRDPDSKSYRLIEDWRGASPSSPTR